MQSFITVNLKEKKFLRHMERNKKLTLYNGYIYDIFIGNLLKHKGDRLWKRR